MKKIVILYYDKNYPLKIDNFKIPIDEETDFEDFIIEINQLRKNYDITYLNNHEESLHYFCKNKNNIDLVVNLADNGFNNDLDKNGFFIELFNYLDIKFTGRQANNVEFFEKKDLMHYFLEYMGIEVPKTIFYYPGMDLTFLKKKLSFLNYPIIIKVGKSGGSLTLDVNSICSSYRSIINKINEIEKSLGKKNVLLLQEFIENAREYSSFLIGNQECKDIQAFTIKVTPNKFYDYEQKMSNILPAGDFYKECDLTATFLKEVEKKLIFIKNVTDCKDYVRFDWLIDEKNRFFLIDFNANPAFDSELVKMINRSFDNDNILLGYVIESALNR